MKTETNELTKQVAEGVRAILADTYALYFKTQNYHWNVEGMEFPFLHELFEKQYKELLAAVDKLAERVRALGPYIPGRYGELTQGTGVLEETGVPDALEMVQRLQEGYAVTAETIRAVIPISQKSRDEGTANLLAERLQAHEKAVWMLGSCLKKKEEKAAETQVPLKRTA